MLTRNNNNKNNTIFWIEISNIKPNPKQPRKDFDEEQLKYLAESIKQYGILQPLLVTRLEKEVPTGTVVEYELISGERRWRAAQMAGLTQVPVIIRKEPVEKVKLELALIENIQRENLNPIERARAFKQLATEFDMRHHEIAQKVGKSRVYVTNTIRLLNLPQEMMNAVAEGKMTEGQARALLMVGEKPEAQKMLFEDIIYRGVGIREAEKLSRRIAFERARKQEGLHFNEETRELENRLTNILGKRVLIDRKGNSGKISISFSSERELNEIFKLISNAKEKNIFQNEDLELKEKMQQSFEKDKNSDFEAPFGEDGELIIKEVSSPGYSAEGGIYENPAQNEPEQAAERDDSLISNDMLVLNKQEGAAEVSPVRNTPFQAFEKINTNKNNSAEVANGVNEKGNEEQKIIENTAEKTRYQEQGSSAEQTESESEKPEPEGSDAGQIEQEELEPEKQEPKSSEFKKALAAELNLDNDYESENVPDSEERNSDLNPVRNTDIQPSSKLNFKNNIGGEVSNGINIEPGVSKLNDEDLENFTI